MKVLRLPEEDESPISTAPGSPELPASLLFGDINDAEARDWSLEVDVVDGKLARLEIVEDSAACGSELSPLPGLEGLSLW
ncbi:uncharacterized protein PHACADRAFT_260005 [Phanerochaete carnosa HHB-10118-sp]|uniref:Uncharacterized protein n=1 Tax=Phanerochaete carnosa (strain HHB-10118-sp) TaxID=650164 RepID=K5WT23_PHACS|nr:uncharacterized protein PHACADRAFT_260005 [Phanerochaete carnosa HHB-10118-sp]EKM53577.1 hypothetical protein PHACADRAFT_260005 [Phanerochaete carnosa HHB-10118-sp]